MAVEYTDPAPQCATCPTMETYLRVHGVVMARCPDCATPHTRPRVSRKQPRPAQDPIAAARQREARVLTDLAAVARWRAHCSVSALPMPTPYGDPEPRPPWLRLPDHAEPLQPAHRQDPGRSERDRERGRLLDARLRGLERRVAAQRGMHEPSLAPLVAVLVYMAERCGPGRLDPEERGRRGPRKHPPRPVAELVGEAFATERALRAWRETGNLRVASADHGRPLVEAAVRLWLEVDGDE